MKAKLPLFLAVLWCCLFTSLGCEKDPEIIVETVVERDTVIITQQDTVTITLVDTLTITELLQDTATTFMLVRHAETTGIGSNPGLSASGQARTEALQRSLGNVPLAAVFSTNFNRTMQTAQPVADDHALPVNNYNPFALNPFVDGVLSDFHSEVVLVVGHSNTTPDLLNVLIGSNTYSTLPETEYDNLFVVTVFEKGRAEVIHLKYGE